MEDFPGDSVVENHPANTRDMDLIPGWERSQQHRATKPVRFRYWACTPEPVAATKDAAAVSLGTVTEGGSALCNERKPVQQTKTECSQNKFLKNFKWNKDIFRQTKIGEFIVHRPALPK